MADKVFDATIKAVGDGAGGYIQVYSDFDEASEIGKISINVQVFGGPISEESADAELQFSALTKFDILGVELIRQTAFTLCIIGQVGAKVWADFRDCKAEAERDNPGAGHSKIWHEAITCLAKKHAGITAVFGTAIGVCTFAIP